MSRFTLLRYPVTPNFARPGPIARTSTGRLPAPCTVAPAMMLLAPAPAWARTDMLASRAEPRLERVPRETIVVASLVHALSRITVWGAGTPVVCPRRAGPVAAITSRPNSMRFMSERLARQYCITRAQWRGALWATTGQAADVDSGDPRPPKPSGS